MYRGILYVKHKTRDYRFGIQYYENSVELGKENVRIGHFLGSGRERLDTVYHFHIFAKTAEKEYYILRKKRKRQFILSDS